MEFVNVTTQAELDEAVKNGNIPVCGNGFFRASGSATVRASGSATVRASGSATVWAFGSATVRAFGSATVEAFDSATVRASAYVGVTRHGTRAKVNGGVLIQVPEIKTTKDFCDFYGLKVSRGSMVVFKLVSDQLVSGHGTSYPVAGRVTCPDWNPEPRCGGGLHFSPRPFMAHKYASGTRYLACRVKVTDTVVITDGYGTPDKVKAKACTVLHEVDADGERVAS